MASILQVHLKYLIYCDHMILTNSVICKHIFGLILINVYKCNKEVLQIKFNYNNYIIKSQAIYL